MNTSNLTKALLPAALGLLVTVAVVGWWVNEILQASWRTDGTHFSKYAVPYPAVKNPHPSESFFCAPSYQNRWVGCNMK